MPNVSSPLGTSNSAVPLVRADALAQAAGFSIIFANLTALTTAVTGERANIAASSALWSDGQPLGIASEFKRGVTRVWNLAGQHARDLLLRPGLVVTLPADSNVLSFGSGAPTLGSGVNGDVMIDDAEGLYYVKAAGVWARAGSVLSTTTAQAKALRNTLTGSSGSATYNGSAQIDTIARVGGRSFTLTRPDSTHLTITANDSGTPAVINFILNGSGKYVSHTSNFETGAGGSGSPAPDAPAFGVSRIAGIYGDSLTEHDFGVTPWYWHNALQGAPLKTIVNGGLSGQTIFGLISQLDNNDWKNYFGAGLVGLPAVGWLGLRIGTNGVGSPISNGDKANYQTVVSRLLAKAEHVIIYPLPPRGGVATSATYSAGYNDYLRDVLVPSNSRLHWVDDCADIRDPTDPNKVLPQFFASDEIHMNAVGTYRMGQTAKTRHTQLFSNQAYASPLIIDSNHVYPAFPQWNPNPTGAGATGTNVSGGWTGTTVAGNFVGSGGGGSTSGVASVVAADSGDANQTPWQRLTPSSWNSTGYISLAVACAGRAFTSSDPAFLNQLLQVRFVGVDASKFWRIRYWMQDGNTNRVTQYAFLVFSGDSSVVMNDTAVLQQEYPRIYASASGTPIFVVNINGAVTGSGAMGSFDFRNLTVEG